MTGRTGTLTQKDEDNSTGYTHYWEYKPNKITDTEKLRTKFRKAVADIQKAHELVTTRGIKICGGLGEGAPIITESEIWFNGDRAQELDHETFHVRRIGDREWTFCKTARKPYDLLAGLSLIFLQKHLGKAVFSYSSDGDDEDWADIYAAYHELTGKEAPRFKKG